MGGCCKLAGQSRLPGADTEAETETPRSQPREAGEDRRTPEKAGVAAAEKGRERAY